MIQFGQGHVHFPTVEHCAAILEVPSGPSSGFKASPAQKQELIALTNQVPFDDRPNTQSSLADISLLWIKEYLRVSRARLFEQVDALPTAALLEQMELLSGPPEHRFPRNVALMLFCETPEKFFPYTYIELVDFQRGAGGKTFTEYTFRDRCRTRSGSSWTGCARWRWSRR